MKDLIIDPQRCYPEECLGGVCLAKKACPVKALWQEEPYAMPFLSGGRCNGCSRCIAACPLKAIHLN